MTDPAASSASELEQIGAESAPAVASPRTDPRNRLNDLSGAEWIQSTKSFWFQKGLGSSHPESRIERLHPAPFSYQDIVRLIEFFTKSGETVLDPFSGVGSTLKACIKSGRRGIGIELIHEWARLSVHRMVVECGTTEGQAVLHGDARDLLPTIQPGSVDFVVTSPPYWGILNKKPDHKVLLERIGNGLATRYSDVASAKESKRDLANVADYAEFLTDLTAIFDAATKTLRPERYLAVVVSDFRHAGEFIPFHADLAYRIRESCPVVLKGITVLAQNHKKLYPYGYPYAFVPNVHHQYILIFQKRRDAE
jgi:DNA modification methylase